MTADHDPLCWQGVGGLSCICDVLANARADERGKILHSIETNDSAAGLIVRGIIAQAVREERERIAETIETANRAWLARYSADPRMVVGPASVIAAYDASARIARGES